MVVPSTWQGVQMSNNAQEIKLLSINMTFFYDKVNVSKILPALNAKEWPCLALALINLRVETIEALNLIEYVRKLNCMHLKVQFHLSFSSR